MYRVLYGDKLLHDPRSDVYYLAELSLDQNQNECGYCEFTMSPRHPLYDALDFRPGKFDYKGDLCPECLKQLDLFIHTSQYKEE